MKDPKTTEAPKPEAPAPVAAPEEAQTDRELREEELDRVAGGIRACLPPAPLPGG